MMVVEHFLICNQNTHTQKLSNGTKELPVKKKKKHKSQKHSIVSGSLSRREQANNKQRVIASSRVPAPGPGSRSGTGGSAGCCCCWPETPRPGPLAAWAPCPRTPGSGAAGRCRSTPPRRPGNGSRQKAANRSRPSPDPAWWRSVGLRLSRTASNRIA